MRVKDPMTRSLFLLCAAAMLMASPATAQTYETGSQMTGEPRSSAQFGDEVDFTTLSPTQIAADTAVGFNPRTGVKEWTAPTFDPFEGDDTLAASVNLRSMDRARNLDGDRLTDGALLEVSLFYSDDGDRRFGLTRDALFLNGDPVSMTLRDSRELECSSRVTDRIYRYDDRRNRDVGNVHIWVRPTYRGHRGFSHRGYYDGYRGRDNYRRGDRTRRRGLGPRPRADHRPRVRRTPPQTPPRTQTAPPPVQPDTLRPYYPHSEPRIGQPPQVQPRPRDARRQDGDTPRPVPYRGQAQPRIQAQPRAEPRRVEPRAEPRAEPRPEPRPVVRPAPAPRATPPSRPAPRARPATRENSQRTRRDRSRISHEMFPGDGADDVVVVSARRNCAREDQLRLFISQDRLDAARFDGLTLIVRDITVDPRTGQTTVYDERPLYIPPNYIAGFQLAQTDG